MAITHILSHYSVIAAKLMVLTGENSLVQVKFTVECGKAFVKLKTALSDLPVLHSQDYGHGFVVQTDASDQGMKVVLYEVIQNMRIIL